MTTFTQAHRISTHRLVLKDFLATLESAYGLWLQRRALSRLDDAALQDIGVSRSQAMAEARRRPWDVPAHWLR